MLATNERRIVFGIFCLTVVAGVIVDIILALKGSSILNSVLALAVGLALGGFLGRSPGLFIKMISQNFLDVGITPTRLHAFSSQRYRIIADARLSGDDDYVTRTNLVRNTLKFCEECLAGWVPGSHFEFCAFVDKEMPLMFAYFDSGGDFTSRSMKEREHDPKYYVQQRYEVTGLLREPSSQPLILSDTSATGYTYATERQRNQIRSTVLFCPDVSVSFALVITSDVKKAFENKNTDVMRFVKYVAETVCSDLSQDDFLSRIRDIKPELFGDYEKAG